MVLPTALLVHSATLVHYSGDTVDSYGTPVPATPTSSTVSCRFVGPQESMRSAGRGLPYIASTTRVLLPPTTVVSEQDTITSTVDGFTGTYNVSSVKKIYEAAQTLVSHISCELAAVGATGGA